MNPSFNSWSGRTGGRKRTRDGLFCRRKKKGKRGVFRGEKFFRPVLEENTNWHWMDGREESVLVAAGMSIQVGSTFTRFVGEKIPPQPKSKPRVNPLLLFHSTAN